MKTILTLCVGAALFAAGTGAAHLLMPPEPPKRETPPPPPADRTGEVLDELARIEETLKAFAAAVDAAAEERQGMQEALAAARKEGASGTASVSRALAELRQEIAALSRRQDDLAAALAAKPAEPAPVPVPAPVEVEAPTPAPEPPAPEAPSPPKRKSLAELLAEKKRVDPRDRLTRYRLVEGYCNVGFDGVSTIHNFTGQSKKVEGEFQLHVNDLADQPSGRLSVATATLDTGNADRDVDMRKALGTEEIVCELLGFEKGAARVRFTIHGEAKEVVTPVELTFDKGLLHVKGETKIKLSDYGVKVKAAALGMVTVEDQMTIWWDLYAEVARDAPR